MLLAEAIILLTRNLKTGTEHNDRKRTIELAELYQKLITGKDIETLLKRFVQREDAALFEQRAKITKAITPAVASSIRKPFNKVVRNDRVRKSWDTKNDKRNEAINTMVMSFFGAARKKNRGLDYWLKTRFLELQFTDPNAWVVLEWAVKSGSEVARVRPFEVSAHMAKNWLIVNDEVVWLQVEQDIIFKSTKFVQGLPESPIDKEVQDLPGKRHTIYDEDVTVVFEQVDENYLKFAGISYNADQLVKIQEATYLVSSYTPNLGYVPAYRIGYVRDETTKGRTFVNPWHEALCFFEKSLKTVSEMDLTMALHVFPQKLQYVTRCSGEIKNNKPTVCNNGRNAVGGVCGACKGSGVQIHTTTADVINVPMPDDPKEMFNLDNMLVYKAPPIETVRFQNEYILQLEKQCHQAVFNSQVFVKKTGPSEQQSGGDVAQTATEADFNMQSVYDALEPFTEKYSELWMDFVTSFALIAGAKLAETTVVHNFPADFKLKTSDILLSERRTASTSGAPSFMISVIDDDLADIIFNGDDLQLTKYYVKRRYFPFPGKTADEIALILSSALVPKKEKVLYLNFDLVFKELEKTNPEIWAPQTAVPTVDKLVEAKIIEVMARIESDAPEFDIGGFRASNPATDGAEGSNNTAGNEGGQQKQEPTPGEETPAAE